MATSQPVGATKTSQMDFGQLYETDETVLELRGIGLLRYMGIFKIYTGALYLPPDVNPAQVLDDVPKRLEVKYLRSFQAKDIGPATISGIKNNVDYQTFKQLESRIAYHNSLYEDVEPGDRVSLTYIPAMGTILEINGKVKGSIEGPDFAEALFSMWLGDKPFDSGFKRALLGKN
jgi:hypothetical protein